MFNNTHLYEVYHHPDLPAEEATMLVRQGISIWAFFFHIGWLIYHRLWLESVVFFILYAGAIILGERLGLSEVTIGILQLALQTWLATSAADIRGHALERKGFALVDVATGKSQLEAERHYYYTHTHA
jgi:hypothetical protein